MDKPSTGPAPSRFFFPSLAAFYERVAQPLSWLVLRVVVGAALVIEGWPKILAPFAQTGFVESLGFYPGWLWSLLLAAMQVFGGIALVIGLLTRPVALANAVMLAVTWWFHATHPYGDAFLTPEGIAALKSSGEAMFSPDGIRRLADGGAVFLHQVQAKAEFLSAIWAAACLVFAGHGGGPLSVDRKLLKKEF